MHVGGDNILPEVSTSYAVHQPRVVQKVLLSSREADHQTYGIDVIEQQRSRTSRASYAAQDLVQSRAMIIAPERLEKRKSVVVVDRPAAQDLVQSRAVIIAPERLEKRKSVVVVEKQAARELERSYGSISPRIVGLEEKGAASRVIVEEGGRRLSLAKRVMATARPRPSVVAIRPIERRQIGYVASPPAAVHYVERRSVPAIKVGRHTDGSSKEIFVCLHLSSI